MEMNITFHKLNGELVEGTEPFDLEHIARGRLNDDGEVNNADIVRVGRADLSALFLGQARELGIDVSYGKRVADYFEDDTQAGVVLEDGSKVSADVVVAADGVGTKSHRLINGHDIRAMPSKHSIFRASYAIDPVLADPELAARFAESENDSHFQLWTGKGIGLAVARFPKEIQWYITHEVRYNQRCPRLLLIFLSKQLWLNLDI